MSVEFVVEDDAQAAARAAGEILADAAATGGDIALSGGKSPEDAHETAARITSDWSRVRVWWGDERCVAPTDDRSNFAMAKRTLLDHLEAPPAEVHRIHGEADPAEAAHDYHDLLAGVRFRLNLLGVGPDGHTASLFPDAPSLDERDVRAVAAEPALDPRVMRVTLTIPALENAETVLFLVTGEDKAEAVARAFSGPESRATPASLVRARGGRTLAILDRAAASLLTR